jgi:hypothetical protein
MGEEQPRARERLTDECFSNPTSSSMPGYMECKCHRQSKDGMLCSEIANISSPYVF